MLEYSAHGKIYAPTFIYFEYTDASKNQQFFHYNILSITAMMLQKNVFDINSISKM
jgi:hypothetical protein